MAAPAPCRELTGLRRAAAAARPQVPGRRGASELCLAPRQRRGVRVVAAISEDLPRLAAPGKKGAAEGGGRPEKVLMRAALTVRRKQKEDLKEAMAGHLDALWDMVGRSVALELISTKIHPSKHRTPFPPLALLLRVDFAFPSLNLSELLDFPPLPFDRC